MVKIRTFSDMTVLLSLPIGGFGVYLAYLNFLQGDFLKMSIVCFFLVLISPKWVSMIRRLVKKDA